MSVSLDLFIMHTANSYPQNVNLANILQKAVILFNLASFPLVGPHPRSLHRVNVPTAKNLQKSEVLHVSGGIVSVLLFSAFLLTQL